MMQVNKSIRFLLICFLVLFTVLAVLLNTVKSSATGFISNKYDADNGSWSSYFVTLDNTREADLMVRTGDIDNLGFGWPENFDPFSGKSTPIHPYPWIVDNTNPDGTDRIMVPTSYKGLGDADGYANTTQRPDNSVHPIKLFYDDHGMVIKSAILQMFVDDFQPIRIHSKFQTSINGIRAPFLDEVINSLDQTGPVGKLISVQIPNDYLYLLKSSLTSPANGNSTVMILIDDTTTGKGDGFAIDFVKLLINPKILSHTGTVSGMVTDSRTNKPLVGVKVSAGGIVEATTNFNGEYKLENVPAGLAVIRGSEANYETALNSVDVTTNSLSKLNILMKSTTPSQSGKEGNYLRLDLNNINLVAGLRGGEFLYNNTVPLGGNVTDGGTFYLPWFSSNVRHTQSANMKASGFKANALYFLGDCGWWGFGDTMYNKPVMQIIVHGKSNYTFNIVSGKNIWEWSQMDPYVLANNTKNISLKDNIVTNCYMTKFEFPTTEVSSVEVKLLAKTKADNNTLINQQIIEVFGITLGNEVTVDRKTISKRK
jgi:hypothetical protein